MALREARERLATAEQDFLRMREAVAAELAAEQRRVAAARARLESLEVEREALAERRKVLERMLATQHEEDETLALGAMVRDEEGSWNSDPLGIDRRARLRDGYRHKGRDFLFIFLGVAALYALIFIFGK